MKLQSFVIAILTFQKFQEAFQDKKHGNNRDALPWEFPSINPVDSILKIRYVHVSQCNMASLII